MTHYPVFAIETYMNGYGSYKAFIGAESKEKLIAFFKGLSAEGKLDKFLGECWYTDSENFFFSNIDNFIEEVPDMFTTKSYSVLYCNGYAE